MDRRRFIHITGVSGMGASGMVLSGLTLSGWMPLPSCSTHEPDLEEKLKQQALLAFKRFEEVWDFNDFWKRGNTFDACLVFAAALNQKWPDDPEVKKILDEVRGKWGDPRRISSKIATSKPKKK